MDKYIDFHMHTRYSDGELTPQNLVQVMAARGMDVIAISDHDNFRQFFDARVTAEKYGVRLIPATEITTPNYHLLGYGFNPDDPRIHEFLDHASSLQEQGTAKKVSVLQDYGVPITMDKLHAEFPLGRLGKGNIKATMFADKECRQYLASHHPSFSPKEAFSYFLGKNGIAHRDWEKDAVSPKEAIDAVHASGGIIGIAHAPRDVVKSSELEHLALLGIDFLEIQPLGRVLPPKGKITYESVEAFSQEKGLALTFGSDYHGPNYERPLLDRTENILKDNLANLLNNCSGVVGKF